MTPFFSAKTVNSKTFVLGVAGVLGAAAAGFKVWAETHDWWKAAIAGGFALYSLFQVTRRDSISKLEGATVMSNLETATRVENAVAQIAPTSGLPNLAALDTLGQTWQPFGGNQGGGTFDFNAGNVNLGGEALSLGSGAEVTRTLRWGDLPADGGV